MIKFETIVLLLVLSNFLIAIFLFVFRILYRNNDIQFGLLIVGKFLQSFSWLFILFRPEISLVISVIFGNILLFIGLALEVYVLVNVTQEKISKELFYLIGIALVVLSAMLLFYKPEFVRYALHSFCIAFFVLYAATKILFLSERTHMQIVTVVMAAVVGSFFVLKGLTHILKEDTADIMFPNMIRSITITIFFLLSYLWPILFLFIRYEFQNKRLCLMNAAREKIFSIISHDLRSPYTAILGLSDLILDNSKKKEYGSMKEHSEMLKTTAQQSLTLLNNLLEWMQIQTGRLKFMPEKIQVDSMIKDIIELFQPKIVKKKLELAIQCDSDFIICGDKFMIQTVLRNLIGNAIKFTNSGGQIKVMVEKMNGKTKISVVDSGVGISDEDKNKILNSDVIFSNQGTNNEKGTGLGLVLCKEFIAKHNGSFNIKSTPGEGSSFYFIIPSFK